MTSEPASGHKFSVFISYSRDDIGFADRLDAALRLYGFATILDRHGITGGEDWRRRLGNLIREAETVIFVLSPSSALSEICGWEVAEAARLRKRILPVVCQPLADAAPPTQLSNLNYVFFHEEPKSPGSGFGTGLTRLVTALNTDLDWLREHTRLLLRANEWVARRPKAAPEPTELHLDFIKASETWQSAQQNERQKQLEERERLVRQAETDRAAREAAQLQATQSARREAAQARRTTRLTLAGLVVAIALALAAGGAGLYARGQQLQAIAEKQRAESEKLRAETEKQAVDGLIRRIKVGRANSEGLAAMKRICGEASDVTAGLAATTDAANFSRLANRFWELYAGEINLIKMRQKTKDYAGDPKVIANSRIESMMVRFGVALRSTGSPPAELPQSNLFSPATDVKTECDACLG